MSIPIISNKYVQAGLVGVAAAGIGAAVLLTPVVPTTVQDYKIVGSAPTGGTNVFLFQKGPNGLDYGLVASDVYGEKALGDVLGKYPGIPVLKDTFPLDPKDEKFVLTTDNVAPVQEPAGQHRGWRSLADIVNN